MTAARLARVLSRLDTLGAVALAERIAQRHRVALDDMLGDRHWPRESAARRELISVLHGTLGLHGCDLARLFERDRKTIYVHLTRRQHELARDHQGVAT